MWGMKYKKHAQVKKAFLLVMEPSKGFLNLCKGQYVLGILVLVYVGDSCLFSGMLKIVQHNRN